MADTTLFYDPSGRVQEVPNEQVPATAAQDGWAPVRPDIADQMRQQQHFQLGEATIAGTAAIARGLTFGLSDRAIAAVGPNIAEEFLRLKNTYPATSFVGETGAAIGSLFIPGSLVGKMGGLAKGAGAATRTALGEGLLARAAGGAVQGGLEGAAFGAGGALTEASLGSPEHIGEHLLAHGTGQVLMGALLGGGLGAGGPIFADVAAGASRKLAGLVEAGGAKAMSGIEKTYPRVAEFLGGPEAKLSDLIMGNPMARAAAAEGRAGSNLAALAKDDVWVMKDWGEGLATKFENSTVPEIQAAVQEFRQAVQRAHVDEIFDKAGDLNEKTWAEVVGRKAHPEVLATVDELGSSFRKLSKLTETGEQAAISAGAAGAQETARAAGVAEKLGAMTEAAKPNRVPSVDNLLKLGGGAAGLKYLGLPGGGIATAVAGFQAAKKIGAILENPVAVATILNKIESSVASTAKIIDKGVGGIFKATEKISVPAAGVVAGVATKESGKEGAKLTSEFIKVRDEVLKLSGNPELMIEKIDHMTQHLREVAPETATSVQVTQARAIAYLRTQIKEHPPAGPLSPPWEYSKAEMSKFMQAVEVVRDPMHVLEEAKKGTLTAEHVKALAAVYPKLLDAIQVSFLDHATNSMHDSSYRAKLMGSLLLGKPMDASLKNMGKTQASFKLPGQAAQPMPGAGGSAAAGKVTLGVRSMSATQALGARK